MYHILAGTGGCILNAAVFSSAWLICYRIADHEAFTFELRGPGSFESRLANYTKTAETLIGLSSGSVVLLAGSSILKSNGRLPWFYASPLALLGMSVVCGIFFIGLLNFFYEGYLNFPNSYTRLKYSLVQALGFSSLICFGLAYAWLVLTLTDH